MKWIKANERLPDKDGMYITKIRVIEEGLTFLPVAYNRFKFKEWENPSVCNSKGEIIEWLEESPDPKDQRIAELEAENERLRGLVEKADDLLAYFQVFTHGEDGKRITKLRATIQGGE